MQIESKVPKVFGPDYGPMLFEVPKTPHSFHLNFILLNDQRFDDINIVIAHAGWIRTNHGKVIWCFNDGQEIPKVIDSMKIRPDIVIACSGSYFELNTETPIKKLDQTIQIPYAQDVLSDDVSFFYGVDPFVTSPVMWNFDQNQNDLEYLRVTFPPGGLIKRGKIALLSEM